MAHLLSKFNPHPNEIVSSLGLGYGDLLTGLKTRNISMFVKQHIPEVILVKSRRFGDERGFFQETYRKKDYEDGGIPSGFIQDNHSFSTDPYIIRGLHFQTAPHAQGKLVRCTRGRILDVAVDLRQGSPWFGQYVSAELSAENGQQLFIPVGFAHGFCTLTANCDVQYKVSAYYNASSDAGIAWNDPTIKIDWPIGENAPILSDKDAAQPFLSDILAPFTYPTL